MVQRVAPNNPPLWCNTSLNTFNTLYYSIPRTRQQSKAINVVCLVLFLLFGLIYIYSFQGMLLSMAQHIYSHGRTTYYDTFFAGLILSGLTILGILFNHSIHLPLRFRALAWFPSCLMLGLLTRIHLPYASADSCFISTPWIYVFVVAYLLMLVLVKLQHENRSENSALSTLLWPNLTLLFIQFTFICMLGNTNRQLHDELLMERYVQNEEYEEIVQLGDKQLAPTRSMTCIRAYALSQRNELGDRLFVQQSGLSSQHLLPLLSDSIRPANMPSLMRQHLGGFPIHDMNALNYLRYKTADSLASAPIKQYLLCALLLERRLPEFVDSLISFYVPKDTLLALTKPKKTFGKTKKQALPPIQLHDLPRHYAEALILYSHQHTHPRAFYVDEQLLSSFLGFYRAYTNRKQKKDDNPDEMNAYTDTYWFYYYYK